MRRLWHLACTARELRVRRPRSDSAILCLPETRCTGRRGRVRRRARTSSRPRRSSTSRYRCATEYVKYAHESSVNKSKSARIQTQDTAQKCSCCFPTHVCQSLHQMARDTQDRGAQAACFADSTTADASVSATMALSGQLWQLYTDWGSFAPSPPAGVYGVVIGASCSSSLCPWSLQSCTACHTGQS